MNSEKSWQSHFPIKQSDEHQVSRRQFGVFCACSSLALAAGIPVRKALREIPSAGKPVVVASKHEMEHQGYKLFEYPDEGYPCILIKRAKGEFAAYSQSCTHLKCPVHYDAATDQLVCPCHSGYFDAENGSVIAGPPQRPLPRYQVKVLDGNILVGPEWEGTATNTPQSV